MKAEKTRTGTLLLALALACGARAAAAGGEGYAFEAPRARKPEPRVFAARIVARPARLDLDGDGSLENVLAFNGSVPGPEIRVRVGDIVRVRYRNRLDIPSSLHWHGIEVTNRSDGTTLTQNEIPPGGKFRYEFRVTRPGVFWYHPHVRPSNPVFKGLYGPLIVTDESEDKLARLGVIPRREQVLVLSDITVCKAPGENDELTFPADPALPWAGPGAFPGHRFAPSPRELCETPLDRDGRRGIEPLAAGAVPNVQAQRNCLEGGPPCRVNPGQWVLVNGRVPAARGGSPESPGELAAEARPVEVTSGEGVRLRLVNASLMRFFRLRLGDAGGTQLPIYRIGGQGGLLDRVQLEGGIEQELDTRFDRGEIVLGPSERADVVVIPTGRPGDVLTLWTRDYSHTGQGFALTPTVPILHFRIAAEEVPENASRLAERTRLLKHPRVNRPVERLGPLPPTADLVDPQTLTLALPGTADPKIRFTNTQGPSIDDVPGIYDTSAVADFRDVPFLASSRFARVGGLLRLEVENETDGSHVFHLHGFSFQPIRYELAGRRVYRFRQAEFVDSLDIPPRHSLVFKVLLEDRPLRPGTKRLGGAVGRWLLHCHLYGHAALGMISELVVLPEDSDSFLPDRATSTASAKRSSGEEAAR